MTLKGFVPERPDLFERASLSFANLEAAISRYRQAVASHVQSPGELVTDAELTAFYSTYVNERSALVEAMHADIVFADQLVAEIVAAIQATNGQQPPFREPKGAQTSGKLPVRLDAPAVTDGATAAVGAIAVTAPSAQHRQDWECSLELIDETLEVLDEIPEAGREYADSVGPKLAGMRRWINKTGRVTPKMARAIESMNRGALRWLHSD